MSKTQLPLQNILNPAAENIYKQRQPYHRNVNLNIQLHIQHFCWSHRNSDKDGGWREESKTLICDLVFIMKLLMIQETKHWPLIILILDSPS